MVIPFNRFNPCHSIVTVVDFRAVTYTRQRRDRVEGRNRYVENLPSRRPGDQEGLGGTVHRRCFPGPDTGRRGAVANPGARTDWHQHPVGQTLWAVAGVGRVQVEGSSVQELRPGDTAIIPPNARHWHGAAPDRIFTHLAMSETGEDGGGTQWFEKVSDADYTG